jgi:hypothetical protein
MAGGLDVKFLNGSALAAPSSEIYTVTIDDDGNFTSQEFPVNKTGTPVDNQIAIWASGSLLEGSAGLTFDGTDLTITGNINGVALTSAGSATNFLNEQGNYVTVSSVSLGINNQIPVTNTGGTDFEYSANFIYEDGVRLIAKGQGSNATAIGASSLATGQSTVALGFFANATANGSVSIASNEASGVNSISIGSGAHVRNTGGISIGNQAGNNTGTHGTNNVSIGRNANGAGGALNVGSGSIALGLGLSTTGIGAIAIGNHLNATAQGAIIMGYNTATVENSLTDSFELTWDSVTAFKVGILYGTGITVNIDPDTNLTAAVNGSLAYDSTDHDIRARVNGSWVSLLGGSNNVTKIGTPVDNQIAIWTGDGVLEGNTGLIFDGTDLTITGNINGVSLTSSGSAANFLNEQGNYAAISPVSLGTSNQIPMINTGGTDFEYSANFTYENGVRLIAKGVGSSSIAIGALSQANASGSIAIGLDAGVNTTGLNGDSSISIGENSNSSITVDIGLNSLAVGVNTVTSAVGAVAIGYWSQSTAQGAIIMGYNTAPAVNSLTDSFELAWDGLTAFKTGILYGTGITVNPDPDTFLTAAVDGSLAYDSTDHDVRARVNGSWISLLGNVSNNVTKIGTPVDGQIAIWTGDGILEGNTTLRIAGDDTFSFINTPATGRSKFFLQVTGGNELNIESYSSASIGTFLGIPLANNANISSEGALTLATIGSGNDFLIGTNSIISATVSGTNQNWDYNGNDILGSGHIRPNADDASDLGTLSNRWRDIYASSSMIITSDKTLKKNIKTSDLGLEFINSLDPSVYRSKTGKRNHYGFIAQQIEEVLDGKDFAGLIKSEQGLYGLRYEEFISPVVKSVQEVDLKIIKLKEEITSLKLQIKNKK